MHILTVDFLSASAPVDFTRSLKETGFAVIKNHSVPWPLIQKMYAEWLEFFNSDAKLQYPYEEDGYVPAEVAEIAKGNTVRDIKEFFQYYSWGRCPETLRPMTHQLYECMVTMASTLLSWLEANTPVEVKQQFSIPLAEMIKNSSQSMLRILHYPPLTGEEEEGAIRAADHEDINLLTLLPASTQAGLEVKDSQGNWYKVKCDPETIIVNVGDMLQLCSGGYYRSTTHRVVKPEGQIANQSRMSLPLFLHPYPEVRLSKTHTQRSYLNERLRELGLLNDS